MNHRELTTESNRTKLSIMRFCRAVSSLLRLAKVPIITYLIAFFQQHLVVFAQGNAKDDGCHILKAMDPFFSLASLASHIKHAVATVSQMKAQPDLFLRTVCSIGPW